MFTIIPLSRRKTVCLTLFMLVLLSGCGSAEEPLTIGLVTNNANGLQNIEGFKGGMSAQGYIEGETVHYLSADAPLRGEALTKQLSDFVEQKVDLIFTAGTPTGVAAYRTTAKTGIPVVFGVIADPIKAGVMTDLVAPGGNMSGVNLSRNQALRLELFLRLAPTVKNILVPYNPADSAAASAVAQLEEAGHALGIEINKVACKDGEAVGQLLASIGDDIDALFLLPDSMVNKQIESIVQVSLERNLPVSAPSNTQVKKGSLMAYGIIHYKTGEHAARIAHRVLQGVDIATLPVETATSYLGINLATAAAIGIEVPDQLLQQAKIIVRVN